MRLAALLLFFALTLSAPAATLRGRVKDRQCAVLSQVNVRIQPMQANVHQPERNVVTDDAGNYTAELPAGKYRICIQREQAAALCEQIDMPVAGEKWITTQLRDAAPDLSNLGNRSY